MNRLDPQALRTRLQAVGAWSNKAYGQHFLIDGEVLEAVVAAADVQAGDRVIEVGPGPGVLTEKLLGLGADVQAFEADSKLVALLREDFPGLDIVEGDALQTIPEQLDNRPYKVVANIPYQITTPLLRLFLEGNLPAPVSLTLLMQKEVGERLAAKPRTGERGYLSVLTQYFCDVQLVFSVPPRCFWPEPAVDSVVVHLAVKADRPLAGNERAFFDYVKTRFLEPRKQLKNVLAGMRHETSAQVVEELSKLGLPENIRAQELTEADWLKLYNAHV